jgi:hypothetical protein
MQLSPERAHELLEQYKQRKAALDEANAMLDKMRADQREKQEAFWAKLNKPRVVKTDVPHKCSGCNCTIPVGSKAVIKSKLQNVSGSGWTGAFLTTYTCLICSGTLKDAKVKL